MPMESRSFDPSAVPLDTLLNGNSSLGIIVLRARDLRIVANNRQAELMYGFAPRGLVGLSVLQLTDFPEETKRNITAAIHDPSGVTMRKRHRRSDGSSLDVNIAFSVLIHEHETYICKYIQDATVICATEQLLQQSLERFRAVADYTYDWESWLDLDGSLVWVNPAVERCTGYSADECLAMVGYPLPLICQEDLEYFSKLLKGAIAGDSGNDIEFRIVTRDGLQKWFAVSWQALLDLHGQRVGCRMSMRDIGDRKAISEELQRHTARMEELANARAEKIVELEQRRLRHEKLAAMGEIAASVAHEINNPMAGIKNAVRLISDRAKLDDSSSHLLRLVRQEIDRVAKLLQQLNQLCRPTIALPTSITVGQVIQDIIALVSAQCLPKAVEIRLLQQNPQLKVALSEHEFRQIIHNLLVNAVDESTEDGIVEVEVSLDPDVEKPSRLHVHVKDWGKGVAPHNLSSIFEPFFTTKHDSKRGGTGLGLAISMSLANALQGTIHVATNSPHGAIFTLDLPLPSDNTPLVH